jgi:hypothetical protein
MDFHRSLPLRAILFDLAGLSDGGGVDHRGLASWLGLFFGLGRVSLADGALRVDAGARVDGCAADRAHRAGRGRGVEVFGIHELSPLGCGVRPPAADRSAYDDRPRRAGVSRGQRLRAPRRPPNRRPFRRDANQPMRPSINNGRRRHRRRGCHHHRRSRHRRRGCRRHRRSRHHHHRRRAGDPRGA